MKKVIFIVFAWLLVGAQTYVNAQLDLYKSITTETSKPDYDVFEKALYGQQKLIEQGVLSNNDVITIVDLRLMSTKRRLWVIDLKQKKVVHHSLVAHGKNTGQLMAQAFSNKKQSYQTSLGFYVTSETYYGKHGYSLRLDGMEKGINDNARERAIVMHGASYVSLQFINAYGRLGRSFGCPAVPELKNKAIIDTIKGGSCLFIYHANSDYKQKSQLLKK